MLAILLVETTRIALGLVGAALAAGAIRLAAVKRSRASFPVLLLLFAAAAVLLLLAISPRCFEAFLPDSRMGRIRLAVAGLSVFILAVTFESIRWTHLKERYALLWVVPCFAMLFMTAFPSSMDWLKATFGMEYASSMLAVVFITMMTAVFVLSKNLSRSERNQAQIAQRCAMLESRIRDLEGKSEK
ncbi:MAG: DUF2304 domain-containing protein [Kiritimatiellia bacterium]|jgi:hypothetical protein